jgi:hypothetical protein
MSLEFISGLVVVLLGLIAGAFGLGHARGTSKAEAKAEQQRTEENAAATVAAAERKADATKEASNVQQTVSHMRDDDVDRELRENLPAPVVVDTACSWVRIIYLTDHDIDVLDKQTKRDILAHNKSVQANCPQSTEKATK